MGVEILCCVDGCSKLSEVVGLCSRHYQRKKRHGDPLGGGAERNRGKICEVDGCGKPHAGRGYCQAHLVRCRKYGSPTTYSESHRCNEKWIEYHKSYSGDDCIVWPFYRGDNGRGMIGRAPKRMSAPRAMCIAAHGEPLDDEMEAAHSCGNGHKGCMNPRHINWSTHMGNVRDRAAHGRDRVGTQINTNKLTEDQVREIRSRKGRQTGVSLAKEFGVSATSISCILSRKSWRWLE